MCSSDLLERPGVVAVYTYDDLRGQVGRTPCVARMDETRDVEHPLLADGAVRYVGQPVAVVRDGSGDLRAFSNVCRHRAHEVLSGAGNTRLITCPYHAWVYGSDGRLLGVPQQRELYPDLDKAAWPLVEVAQLAVYKGTIWATWEIGRAHV